MSETKQLAHSLESKSRSKDVILEENLSFESLLLPGNILKGLADNGFIKPSPIQVKAIPIGRCGFDLIVKSKSGTGKTLVFSTLALESVNLKTTHPQVLILTPTREIAVQIQSVVTTVGQYFEGLHVETFIGGLPLEEDKQKCKSCHIAVGSPGRIKQLIEIGALDIKYIRLFILDEADKLMESAFQNVTNEIYNHLPNKKQIIMCSATYPDEIEKFLSDYMLSPTFVSAEVNTPLLLGVKHFAKVVKCSPNVVQQTKSKNEELLNILSHVPYTQCLVFSNYQTRAESINNFLNRMNWGSTYISGAQSQNDRLAAVSNLKDFKCRIMLSTDLIARGIDAANVDLVINYDIPVNAVTYLHRMGRAGRYGASGVCINLAAEGQEVKTLQNILGAIGGQNLSIPKLEDNFDMTNVDSHNLLFGTVPENAETDNKLKSEITELKRKCKTKPQKVDKVIEEQDTGSVLALLAKGTFEMSDNNSNTAKRVTAPPAKDECKKFKDDFDPTEILKQLAKEGTVPDATTTKLESQQSEAESTVEKSLINGELNNYDSLTQYLNLLNKADSFKETTDAGETNLENVFLLAYKSTLKPSESNWKDCLSKDQLNTFQQGDMELEEQDEDSYCEYEDDNYDFEIEKQIEVNCNINQTTDDFSFMKWIPVEPSEVKNTDTSVARVPAVETPVQTQETPSSSVEKYSNQYNDYFRQCSENLWQMGLNFDTVQHFDEWFCYNWQAQVFAIRDFIRQKIYVQEMAKYQETLDKGKKK